MFHSETFGHQKRGQVLSPAQSCSVSVLVLVSTQCCGEIRKRGKTGCLSKNKEKLAYNSMHSITALENLTTCNTKEDGAFQFPSTFQNTPQHCHIEASPCQTVEERNSWREMVVLIDPWLETAESREKKWSCDEERQWDRFAHEHVGHHLSMWAGEVLQKSCWLGMGIIQRNKGPLAKMCLYSDSNSELSSTFCLVILLLLFFM